jgi:hypothetical protein
VIATLAGPAPSTTTETFALLTTRLQQNQQSVVLGVLGDSTGVTVTGTQTRWPYLVAQALAAMYPAYTVSYQQWNDGNQNYDAAVAVQTGTGSNTLTIYNGSFSGSNEVYATTRLALMIPATPALIILNYGHNQSSLTSAYRQKLYELTRLVEDTFPGAGIVVTAQNPKRADVTDAAAHLLRVQVKMDLAAAEGYGLIDVTTPFLATADFATSLLNGDGIHPSDAAGSPLWAAIVMRHLRKARDVVPRMVTPKTHRMWIPATAFVALEGAPDLAVRNSIYPAWALDAGGTESVVTSVDWPHGWQDVNVYAAWSIASNSGLTGSNNSIRFELGLVASASVFPTIAASATSAMGGGTSSFGSILLTALANNSSAHGTYASRFASFPLISGRPIGLRIRRLGADAADTLAEDLLLRGVWLERAA